jgi:hypothetical protein
VQRRAMMAQWTGKHRLPAKVFVAERAAESRKAMRIAPARWIRRSRSRNQRAKRRGLCGPVFKELITSKIIRPTAHSDP